MITWEQTNMIYLSSDTYGTAAKLEQAVAVLHESFPDSDYRWIRVDSCQWDLETTMQGGVGSGSIEGHISRCKCIRFHLEQQRGGIGIRITVVLGNLWLFIFAFALLFTSFLTGSYGPLFALLIFFFANYIFVKTTLYLIQSRVTDHFSRQ
jgi:hypothetical protein